MLDQLKDFGGALSLLSIIPVPRRWWVADGWQAGRAVIWFPLVGWIVGLVTAGVMLVSRAIFAPLPAAALTLIAWVMITGGLHLDGLIDSCDALCATVSPERRLEIMRDPRAGSFGVIGAGLVLIAKFAALVSLTNPLPTLLIPPIVRALILYPMLAYPSARTTGLGSAYRQGARRTWLAVIWLVPAFIIHPVSILWIIMAFMFTSLFARWAARRLGGGLTGDVYGATCELTEALCLILATAILIQ